jgi:hypothetical protein
MVKSVRNFRTKLTVKHGREWTQFLVQKTNNFKQEKFICNRIGCQRDRGLIVMIKTPNLGAFRSITPAPHLSDHAADAAAKFSRGAWRNFRPCGILTGF